MINYNSNENEDNSDENEDNSDENEDNSDDSDNLPILVAYTNSSKSMYNNCI